MTTPAVVRDVDLDALGRNLDRVRARLAPGVALLASVKADAYGHGVVDVCRRLEKLGVEGLATASLEDATVLRRAGITCRILLFGGQPPEWAPEILAADLTPTVAGRETAEALAAAAGTTTRKVWLKVDCGLGRLGVLPDEAPAFLRSLRSLPLEVEGVYTHLPFTDERGEAWARAGLERFAGLLDELRAESLDPPFTQALSSPGIAAGLPDPGNAVCSGRLLYGFVPPRGDADTWGLEPVMRGIRTRLTHVSHRPSGARVGSGGGYEHDGPTTLAVAPFGTSKGYHQAREGRAEMIHRGRRVPVVGVSLEHVTLDVGRSNAAVGDEVVVLGSSGGATIELAELAAWFGQSALDALVGIRP